MIRVRFQSEGRATWASTLAGARLKFADGRLWRDDDARGLARYQDSTWHVGSEAFEDVLVEETVVVHFMRKGGERSGDFGPFRDLCTHDGVVHAAGQVFACYSPQRNQWIHQPSGEAWDELVICANLLRKRVESAAPIVRPALGG